MPTEKTVELRVAGDGLATCPAKSVYRPGGSVKPMAGADCADDALCEGGGAEIDATLSGSGKNVAPAKRRAVSRMIR